MEGKSKRRKRRERSERRRIRPNITIIWGRVQMLGMCNH